MEQSSEVVACVGKKWHVELIEVESVEYVDKRRQVEEVKCTEVEQVILVEWITV